LSDSYSVSTDYLLGREKRHTDGFNAKASAITELIIEDMTAHQIFFLKKFINFLKHSDDNDGFKTKTQSLKSS
jgi:hypothetical protein